MKAPLARHALCMIAFSACLAVAGCAATGAVEPSPKGPGSARTPTGESPAPQTTLDLVVLGKSTKTEVIAALGPATVVSFDSGYAVWVYRWRGADTTPCSATEVVLLFDPSGLATKARMRSGCETQQ